MQTPSLLSTATALLKEYWGHEEFRPEQISPILSLCEGNDTVAILPTGSGKSICFQVPGLLRGGVCLVVSPLIALMSDQVSALIKRGVPAAYISSDSKKNDVDRILNNALFGGLKFLYVAPERLKNPVFLARIERIDVRTVAVDEAHCISQWGHDFRPAYREIKAIRPFCPKAVWGAYTATATTDVSNDIAAQLSMKKVALHRAPIRRGNLMFGVHTRGDSERMLLESASRMKGSGLVYCGTRNEASLVADRLKRLGSVAEAYHAGLTSAERHSRQKRWMEGVTQILTCTSAFGMGIDKDNVRWVFHAHIPANMESYLQEAGRAGRDGQPSTCMIFPSLNSTENAERNLRESFPPISFVQSVYQGLANHGSVSIGDCPKEPTLFDSEAWIKQHRANRRETESSLRLLQKEGLIAYQASDVSDDEILRITSSLNNGLSSIAHHTNAYTLGNWLVRQVNNHDSKLRIAPATFIKATGLSAQELNLALNELNSWGWIERTKRTAAMTILWTTARIKSESVVIAKENLESQRLVAQAKWEQMSEYLKSKMCKALAIERYFDDLHPDPCAVCDTCRASNVSDSLETLGTIPVEGIPITEWLWKFPLITHQRKLIDLHRNRKAEFIHILGDVILPGSAPTFS